MSGIDGKLLRALENILNRPHLLSQTRMWPSVLQLLAPLSF